MSRVMIAAISSGSGKTTITCGLLQALVNRKLKVSSFKCGPDYIDPMFHTKVIKTKSKNLDSFFYDENTLKYLMDKSMKNTDISIIEGAMGFYDGLSTSSFKGTSYEISKITKTPVILVVNAKGMSRSIVPMIKGFLEYVENSNIKGVILNEISKMIYKDIKDLIEEELNIKVFGYVPNIKDLTIESRHLGLITPSEVKNLEEKLNKLAEVLEETLDIDKIISLANTSKKLDYEKINVPKINLKDNKKIKIAIAYDEAFCFYYEDNINLLKKMGVEIVYFSPIHDKFLPKNINGLILGGGYPELYAKELSNNKSMKESIYNEINNGLITIAECGGFMYLHQEMEDMEGNFRKVCGVIPGRSFRTPKLTRFGYITLTEKKDSGLGEIPAHEFHYFDSTDCGTDFHASKPASTRGWDCMHYEGRLMAGFPHLYYYGNPKVPVHFLKNALEYKKERRQKKDAEI